MLTQKQIAWAAAHDWFEAANDDTGTVWVREVVVRDGVAEMGPMVRFDDSRALREWAGY